MLKRHFYMYIVLCSDMIILALSLSAKIINKIINSVIVYRISVWLFLLSIVIFAALIVWWFLYHKIHKGIIYMIRHYKVISSLEAEMIDAGIIFKRSLYFEIPKIKLKFDEGLLCGELRIRDSLKFTKLLDDLVISSALDRYVVENSYYSSDGNYLIYSILDNKINNRLVFKSFKEFSQYNDMIPQYSLFLDARNVVKIQHMLISGFTGAGKTYALKTLILEAVCKNTDYNFFFADPKGSSLAVIGEAIDSSRSSSDLDEIIIMLDKFVMLMNQRKEEVRRMLNDNVEGDYSDFNLSVNIFVIDEFAAFITALNIKEKKIRDKVALCLSHIVLQGRQLGFFLWIAMQQASAELIPTYIRENLGLKIVLGNSDKQTYVTAFGAGVKIPRRDYQLGEGVFTEKEIAHEPKLLQVSYIKFDILKAIFEHTGECNDPVCRREERN